MINVIDNFLDEDMYEVVYEYLLSNDFKEVDTGEKSFWIQPSTQELDDIVLDKIVSVEGVRRKNILSFFRIATDKVDTDWRIHADTIINGQRPDRALVLYISPSTMSGLHGTAFWNHKRFGYMLPSDVSPELYDEIIRMDSNNIDLWDLHSVVGYRENRAILYPSTYFHSKYPNMGWPQGRMVYVMFYK